jgi:hypothetical protein
MSIRGQIIRLVLWYIADWIERLFTKRTKIKKGGECEKRTNR